MSSHTSSSLLGSWQSRESIALCTQPSCSLAKHTRKNLPVDRVGLPYKKIKGWPSERPPSATRRSCPAPRLPHRRRRSSRRQRRVGRRRPPSSLLAGGRRTEPGLLAIAVIEPVRGAYEPVCSEAELEPFLDGRPGLGFELYVGVGGDRAAGIGSGRHQAEHYPGRQGALADSMARCHCPKDGSY
jgi:hypothetical protein